MPRKIKLDIEELRKFSDDGMTIMDISRHLKVSDDLIRKTLKEYDIQINKPRPRHLSEEEKKNISVKRKQWLKDNPNLVKR